MSTVLLGNVAQINPRGVSVEAESLVSFVGMAELDAVSGTAIPRETRSFSQVSQGYTVFRDRDILAAKITPCWENGKIGQATLEHPIGVGSTEFHVVRPSPEINHRYLLHFLRQGMVRRAGELRMTGSAGQKRVPADFLKTLAVPLPPLHEQRRIAAILDQTDAIRAKYLQVLTHLDSLTQAIFRDMFGDPISNSRGVSRQTIGSLAVVTTGNSPSRANTANYGDDIEWIKSDNLGGDVATRANEGLSARGRERARIAPAGSILVTCIAGSPASIGKASLVDRDVAFNQQINAILPSAQIEALFLLGQLKTSPELIRAKSTGGMKGLVNKSAFQSVEVLTPPYEEQQRYVERVQAITRAVKDAQRALAADSELFASLQSRAFRGEL